MAISLTAPRDIPDRASFADVRRALDRLRRGEAIIVTAPGERRIALSIETLDDLALNRARGLTTGRLRVALTALRATSLGLETLAGETAEFELSGDARLSEIRMFADPSVLAAQGVVAGARLARPVSDRATEGALRLTKLAGLMPAALVGAPIDTDTQTPSVDADQIQRFADQSAHWLTQVAEARVPLAEAEDARIVAFRPYDGGPEHLAIIVGQIDPAKPVLARIHSACFTGDALSSLRCDCGEQLSTALATMAKEGSGVVIYLPQEGRGIGLVNKLRAYALQDAGLDTIDANVHLGFAPDERTYAAAGEILRQLGIKRIRLLTNNPEKIEALGQLGCAIVERVPLIAEANPHNRAYLSTKRIRSAHRF
jgi:GTP cyclohydrolase II